MDARHAVLLIPSKLSGPPQLPFRQLRKRITHLESTPTEIFTSVASKRLTQTLNTLESTLAKNRGRGPSAWHRLQSVPTYFRQGCSKPICPFAVPFGTRHSSLATRHFLQSEAHTKLVSLATLCPKSAKPAPFFSTTCPLFCNFLHFFAPFLFSAPLFSIVCPLFCTFGGRGRGPHLTVGTLRGKIDTHKTPRTPRQGCN
jgi:hypothetical protein